MFFPRAGDTDNRKTTPKINAPWLPLVFEAAEKVGHEVILQLERSTPPAPSDLRGGADYPYNSGGVVRDFAVLAAVTSCIHSSNFLYSRWLPPEFEVTTSCIRGGN